MNDDTIQDSYKHDNDVCSLKIELAARDFVTLVHFYCQKILGQQCCDRYV